MVPVVPTSVNGKRGSQKCQPYQSQMCQWYLISVRDTEYVSMVLKSVHDTKDMSMVPKKYQWY
jgi:hypothetical protein